MVNQDWASSQTCSRGRGLRTQVDYLGQQLVDNRVANTGIACCSTTLLANGIQLVKDDDVEGALVSPFLVLSFDPCNFSASRRSGPSEEEDDDD